SLRCLGGLLDLVSDRRDAAGFRVEAPWPVDSPKSTGAAEMSTSTIEAVARAWAPGSIKKKTSQTKLY
ncbi:hypothetical protein, partial [Enterobacter hormaechei]